MAYTFDGENRIIFLTGGVTSFEVSDLYSRWKDWMLLGDNSKWIPAFDLSVGGDDLGGGLKAGAYYFLTNGWHIKPEEQDYQLDVIGNLFAIPSTEPLFLTTTGPYNVLIQLQTSQLTQLATTGGTGSVWTEQEKQDLISSQEITRKILANRSRVTNNQLIIYEDDGVTEFIRFNLLDGLSAPAEQVIREIDPV